MYGECANFAGQPTPIVESGGTSESAPLTAGVAALVIQAYEKTHGGVAPTPALVKQFITSTADDIQAPGDQQGSGLIDAYRAVLAAESYQAPAAGPCREHHAQEHRAVQLGGRPRDARSLHRAADQPRLDDRRR